jgi:hypothetical protein
MNNLPASLFLSGRSTAGAAPRPPFLFGWAGTPRRQAQQRRGAPLSAPTGIQVNEGAPCTGPIRARPAIKEALSGNLINAAANLAAIVIAAIIVEITKRD